MPEAPAAPPPPAPLPPAPRRAPRRFRRRSRLAAWAKVILPLGALALLSTLFLLARPPGTGVPDIPFARAEEIAREPRLDAPRLSGVARDGTVLTLTATRLTPGAGGGVALDAPRLDAAAPGGGALSLAAGAGRLDAGAEALDLSGGVTLRGDGLVARAPSLRADLAAGTLEARGPVEAEAPFGRLRAGGLSAARAPDGARPGMRLVFTGGVRLLYGP